LVISAGRPVEAFGVVHSVEVHQQSGSVELYETPLKSPAGVPRGRSVGNLELRVALMLPNREVASVSLGWMVAVVHWTGYEFWMAVRGA
jgi:hypothetical protein